LTSFRCAGSRKQWAEARHELDLGLAQLWAQRAQVGYGSGWLLDPPHDRVIFLVVAAEFVRPLETSVMWIRRLHRGFIVVAESIFGFGRIWLAC
jgi:hypothetical protein